MKILGEDKKLFKSGCIYTRNYTKYKDKKNDIIKHVYTEKDEIISFIKNNESSTNIFHSFKLISYDNYIDNYYRFHKIISNQYKEDLLNNNDNYTSALMALMNDMKMKTHGTIDMDFLINVYMHVMKKKIHKS